MAAKQSAEHSHFPWKHVVGFVLSIVLTLLALWVIYTDLSMAAKLWIIFGFAIIQAGLQLLMFMHMTESDSGKIQVGNTLFAAFIAVAIIAGSVWISAAHNYHGDNPEGGSPGAKHSEHSGH
ncbi:cytochrome aa3 quinol oxidase subunit IV [Bacillus haynesii]|uniref:cytochrome aa3 quinol oxidase subunit IV n=1 Tax=Bacillus haynesii TaxID=1925021 RepID=UPI0022803D1B|nr:cytochrome aa3 quinol oxidase subunit IV [Bacillus haynesii]MCY7798336.1 cytochrome aa3 quinol oxidase subunit IV [Bacillus haynesii]